MDKKYTKEHEWIQLIDESTAYVGITEYAQKELGEIVFVDVPTVGETLEQMEVFGSIEAVKTVADLHIPVSGKVLEINDKLDSQPELINESAETDGWIIKVEVNSISDFDTLMTCEEYNKFLKG